MSYLIEKKTSKRAMKKARSSAVSFDQAFKLRRQPDDKLKERELRKANSRRPVSTLDRIKAQKSLSQKTGSARLHMTTPRAKEMEKKLHNVGDYREGFVRVSDLILLHEETSELEKRCVADVMGKSAKGPDGKPVKGASNKLSRAFAICRASLQKSGRIKKGTAELTKKGKGISGGKAKSDDHESKVNRFEKHVVAARKK